MISINRGTGRRPGRLRTVVRSALAATVVAGAGLVVPVVASTPAGAEQLTPVVTGVGNPIGVATDPAGEIFVAEADGTVAVWSPSFNLVFGTYVAPDSVTPLPLGLSSVNGIAYHGGDLWVSHDGEVDVLSDTSTTIFGVAVTADTLTPVVTGLGAADGLAFDAAGNLYVTDSSAGSVSVLPTATGSLFGTTVTADVLSTLTVLPSSGQPVAVAFDGAGNLFISDQAADTVWVLPVASATVFGLPVSANALSNLAPDILGSNLGQPQGLAFDGSGNLYLVNGFGVSVLSDSGGTLFGTAVPADRMTPLDIQDGADGIVFDGSGNLLLTDGQDGAIVEAAAPTATVTGVGFSGSLDDPQMIISGTGFGSAGTAVAPGCSATGSDYSFSVLTMADLTQGWQAGIPGDCIGFNIVSYTDTRIVVSFGSWYTGQEVTSGSQIHPGDRYTVVVNGAYYSGALEPPGVTGVTPSTGPTGGGTSVTITGSGFTGASAVDFGGTPAASYLVNGDSSITATSPGGPAGATDVTVTGPGGTSTPQPFDRFTYLTPSSFNLVCPNTSDGTLTLPTTITGTIPAIIHAGDPFALSDEIWHVTIPSSVTSAINAAYGAGATLATDDSTTVAATGATPASQPQEVDFPATPVPASGSFVLTGTPTTTPTFTATGSTVSITAGPTIAAFGLVISGIAQPTFPCNLPSPAPTIAFTAGSNGPFAYVTDPGPNTITPVDTSSGTSGTPFVDNNSEPGAIAITPDGSKAFVVGQDSSDVSPVSLATDTVEAAITVNQANAIAITPNGSTAYVTSGGTDTVVPVNLGTDTAGTPIPVGSEPVAVAVTPDGSTAWVANQLDDTVTPVATATDTAGPPVAVGGRPSALAVTPDGSTLYVVNSGSGTVTPVNTATDTAGTPIPVGSDPVAVAVTPDGSTAWVVNQNDDTVTPIATATDTAGTPVAVGSNPTAVAVTPDGSTVDVVDEGDSTVTPIATATDTAGAPITTGNDPLDIAITPDQGPKAALAAATTGGVTTLDASASVAGTSPIASYHWDFGDGHTQVTSVPTTTHTYAGNGTYTPQVTETDQAGASTTVVFTGRTVSLEGSPAARASATVVIASVNCDGQSSCNASVSTPATPTAPAQTVKVSAPAANGSSQELDVTSGPGELACSTTGFTPIGNVTSYNATFTPSGNVKIKDTLTGPHSVTGIRICFQGSSGLPVFLPQCVGQSVVPCASLSVVTGGVKAKILVAPGDPKFRIDDQQTLVEVPTKVSASGAIGGTISVKGTELLGPTGKSRPNVGFTSAVGSTIPGAIVSAAATKIVVKVPVGAVTGPVTMTWSNEVVVSATSVTVT